MIKFNNLYSIKIDRFYHQNGREFYEFWIFDDSVTTTFVN